MSTEYVVGVRIDGNAASYMRAMQQAQRGTSGFVAGARAEFQKLSGFMQSYQGQLASVGLGYGFITAAKNAATLERTLTRVRLTAGMSIAEQQEAYKSMFSLIRQNGGVIDDTVEGFNNLVQAGLKYKEAMEATKAISASRAVTGASEGALSNSLTVASANYGFDLAGKDVATTMLDKMTVAGRLGKAEMEDLSSVFSRVAQNAKTAGMSFETTLGFIEALSQVSTKETLGTLADSTLRLFSNSHYAKDAEKATGVKFFARDGKQRDPIKILQEMREGFGKLTTDAQRFNYVTKAFGKADLDTQRGLKALLGGKPIDDIKTFTKAIEAAGGTTARDLPAAINNAATQAERLKGVLRLAAEDFARPVNDAVTNAIKYLLNSKAQGGLELSGGAIAGGAAASAVGVYALSRIVPGMVGKMIGRSGGLAAGVAEGKALQAAAGVQPVYVTNWAEMNGGGGGLMGTAGAALGGAGAVGLLTKLKTLASLAPLAGGSSLAVAGLGYSAAGVGAAGLAGYGVGTAAYKYGLEGNKGGDGIGELVARFMGMMGSEEAKRSVAISDAFKNSKIGGEVIVRVMGNPSLAVQAEVKPFTGTKMNALGQTMRGAGE